MEGGGEGWRGRGEGNLTAESWGQWADLLWTGEKVPERLSWAEPMASTNSLFPVSDKTPLDPHLCPTVVAAGESLEGMRALGHQRDSCPERPGVIVQATFMLTSVLQSPAGQRLGTKAPQGVHPAPFHLPTPRAAPFPSCPHGPPPTSCPLCPIWSKPWTSSSSQAWAAQPAPLCLPRPISCSPGPALTQSHFLHIF